MTAAYGRNTNMMQHLSQWMKDASFDWVLWVGPKSFVVDYNLHLESLIPVIDKSDQKILPNVLLGSASQGSFQDLMLVKVDYWSMTFFARAHAYPYYSEMSDSVSRCSCLSSTPLILGINSGSRTYSVTCSTTTRMCDRT